MSDHVSQAGPTLAAAVQEVQGVFPTTAALEDAIGRLRLAGFDHADLSLPETQPGANRATPDAGAAEPITETDIRQVRTMGVSMAGTAGAFAAAGVTILTGGAAAPAVAAAAAVGAASALGAKAVADGAGTAQQETREELAQAGRLVLAVHADGEPRQAEAQRIMTEAGATKVGIVTRQPAAIDASGWTG